MPQGGGVAIERFDVPAPGPQQILVRVSRSHVSAGSEMNFIRHGAASYGLKTESKAPMPIGYIAVGRVASIGPGVTGFSLGDRVLTGATHASHWIVDSSAPDAVITRVPDGVSDEAAGFAILGAVGLHGVRRAGLQIDESVAVFGMGMVGQLTLQLARLSGAHPLIAVDLSDMRLERAKMSGATHTINPSRVDVGRTIREITGEEGVETIFQCTQVASILQTLMESAADRGKIIFMGSAPGVAQITLQAELMRRELTIVGNSARGLAQAHPYWQWTPARNRRACLRMLSSGDLRVDPLITHVIAPGEAEAMFDTMVKGSDAWLGVVIKWE